jgi:hypothetical protein
MRYALILLTLLLASCATPKPSPDAFGAAEEGVAAAVSAGAEEHSPVELRFAREKLDQAFDAMASKDYERAIYLIEQSEINSELAIEKTRTSQVRARVTEMVRENEILREDFQNTYGEDFQ